MPFALPWTAVSDRSIAITLFVDHLFGHSTQPVLFIFIQGTFLLNDHAVTLSHRYDGESTSAGNTNASNSNAGNQRDYARNTANELRLRDWDCYKVYRQTLRLPSCFRKTNPLIACSSAACKISNDVISVLIVIYRVKVCGIDRSIATNQE